MDVKRDENPKNNNSHVEQLEMTTLKLPSSNNSSSFLENSSNEHEHTKLAGSSHLGIEQPSFLLKSDNVKPMKKSTSFVGDLCLQSESFCQQMYSKDLENISASSKAHLDNVEEGSNNSDNKNNVVFILGENEQLVGLKKKSNENLNVLNENVKPSSSTDVLINDKLNIPSCSGNKRPKDLKLSNKILFTCNSSDSSPDDSSSSNCLGVCEDVSPCSQCEKLRKRSNSCSSEINNKIVLTRSSTITLEREFGRDSEDVAEVKRREGFDRSQSVPPSDKNKRKCSKSGCKKKYFGVKFDMRQYPQIVTNYMKSKDLELAQLPFGEKALKLNRSFSSSLYENCVKYDFPSCDCEPDNTEALQTPSNASELEFSSELDSENYDFPSKSTEIRENIESLYSPKASTSRSNEKRKSPSTIFEHPLQDDANISINQHENASCCQKYKQRFSEMLYTELFVPR